MNPIELEWKHLKRDEVQGEMFESEAQLVYHVLEGIEARAEEHGHRAEYVNLRSTLGDCYVTQFYFPDLLISAKLKWMDLAVR